MVAVDLIAALFYGMMGGIMIYMVLASILGLRGMVRGQRWLQEHVDAGDHSHDGIEWLH